MSIVRVALDVPLPTLFDYTVDEFVVSGQRVIVPFRRRQLVGVVMECVTDSDVAADRIKPIVQVLHDSAPLSAELIYLLRFCSDYYHYPIGATVLSALPTRLRSDKPITIKPVLYYHLTGNAATLDLATFPKRKVVARRILEKLAVQSCSLAQLKTISSTAGVQLKWLEQEGWVESCEVSVLPVQPEVSVAEHTFANAHQLTAEQQLAVDSVTQTIGYACFLLHGITGSGKTEVYVHLMDYVLQRRGQVLLLVPEINLTPQLESYFHSRFPDATLVSLHSGLSENERMNNWQQAQTGAAQIVLGTRLPNCLSWH